MSLGGSPNRRSTDVTVYEDDVEFVPNFQAKYTEFMRTVPSDWEAIFLGGQHIDPPILVAPGVLRAAGPKAIHRTHAYRVRGPYLAKLLAVWEQCSYHCDHCWGDVQAGHRVYAPAEWLVAQAAYGGVSDISGKDRGTRWWAPKRVILPSKRVILPVKKCGSCNKRRGL